MTDEPKRSSQSADNELPDNADGTLNEAIDLNIFQSSEEFSEVIQSLESDKMRLQAEIQNLQKRRERDVSQAHKYAIERCLGDLIPAIDSLNQGIDVAKQLENADTIVEGMNLTLKILMEALGKHGVEEISPHNQVFDPKFHEAMAVQEVEGQKPGIVLNVFQRGYILNGRVIRPARVIVAK